MADSRLVEPQPVAIRVGSITASAHAIDQGDNVSRLAIGFLEL
jgi:hypothetical protein